MREYFFPVPQSRDSFLLALMRCVSRQLQHSAASCLLRADAAKIITGFNTGGIRARHALMRETLPQLPACRVQPFRPGPTPNHSSQPTRRYSRPRCRRDFCARFRVKRQAAPGRLSLALAWKRCRASALVFLVKGSPFFSCADAGKAIPSFRNRKHHFY